MLEAHCLADLFPFGKLVRRNVSLDWQAFFVWLQVLADCHYVARRFSEIAHQVDYFFEGFAEAGHALPVWSYVIASVIEGKVVDIFSWEMENDRSKFNEEAIERFGIANNE